MRHSRPVHCWLVGHDVIGGRFAINDGSLPGEPGEIVFWAPDSLGWEPLGVGHSTLLEMMPTDRLDVFYEQWRWADGKKRSLSSMAITGSSFIHPLFSVEGRDPATCHKGIVPWNELTEFFEDSARQLGA